jgi:hypothetical protein
MSQNLSGLFEIYQQEPHSIKHDAGKIKDWLLPGKRAFSLSITISFILHVILFGYVSFSNYSLYRHNEEPELIDLKPILSALTQMKTEPGNQSSPQRQISETDEAEILELLTQTPLFDSSISEEERKELAKKLMESYFQLKDSSPTASVIPKISLRDLLDFLKDQKDMGLSTRGRFYSPGGFSDNSGPVYYKINKGSERQLKFLRRLERYEKEGIPVLAGMVTVTSEGGQKDVPAEYYFRDCPYDQILARGASLFYAISGFPSLSKEPLAGPALQREAESAFQPTLYRGDLALYIIRTTKPAPSLRAPLGSRPPLKMADDRVQETLDRLMELPEDQQLAVFVETYLLKYALDDEGLAALTREFIYENLNSVFVFADTFSAAFDFLEELLYNKELQGYFISFWKENPRTKTGAEFLLILASLYDFERRAVAYLFDSYDIAKKVLTGESRFQRAFNQKAKALVIKEICQEFVREIGERGIASEEAVLQEYRNEQIKIYQMLIEMGGGPRDRALYAWGRLCWDEGMYGAAVQKWKEIQDAFAFKTYQEIKPLLTVYDRVSMPVSADYQALVPKINKIFEWESAENNNLLLKRLIKYDKWKKRADR